MIGVIEIAAVILTVAAMLAYINTRFIGLPTTIGVLILAMLTSLLVVLLDQLGIADLETKIVQILASVDFNKTLLHGMLSFLLFAGALHVNLHELRKQKWVILSLATAGVLLSTFLVGTVTWYLLGMFGQTIPFLYCLLFGALISPTDPIAVMATVQRLGISKELETTIAGESLFNDGVGVVVFLVLLMLLQNPDTISAAQITVVFLEEAGGGIVFGLILAGIGYYLTETIDNYKVEVLITLALVMGGYSLATYLHLSGPIAVVIAGLFTGNVLRKDTMSNKTRSHLDDFWELIDEILNVVLFALIGLEVLLIPFDAQWLAAGLVLIPVVIAMRVISVGLPVSLLRLKLKLAPHLVKILVWGGLRGGISVALALSLPAGEARSLTLFLTYVIVIFSIVVQGMTIGPFIKKLQA